MTAPTPTPAPRLPWDVVVEEVGRAVSIGRTSRASLIAYLLDNYWEELGSGDASPAPDHPIYGRFHAVIDAAVSRQLDEQQSWPGVTDNDRLRSAFQSLDAQGVIAIGPAGFTQRDGGSICLGRWLALERADRTPIGNCFFTRQDARSAVEGNGLCLAFGSWKSEDHDEIAKVGHLVVEALRHERFSVEWDGSSGTRLQIPRFEWRERVSRVTDEDVRDFVESWELDLRARQGWPSDDELAADLEERANAWFEENLDFGPRVLERLHIHTAEFVNAERAREATWTGATMNDRLTVACADLAARGIVVNAGMGSTLEDAWGYVGVESKSLPEARGAVLFSDEDVIDAATEGALFLAFGAFEPDADARNERHALLAREVVETLISYGLHASWSGSVHERIVLRPFEWRLRRFTEAPEVTREAAVQIASSPALREERPSFWRRLLGAGSSATVTAAREAGQRAAATRQQFVEQGQAILVRARRDESGFNVRRSRRLRAAYERLCGVRAHASLRGLPFVFTPMDEYVCFEAMPAIENLLDDAVLLRERGAQVAG